MPELSHSHRPQRSCPVGNAPGPQWKIQHLSCWLSLGIICCPCQPGERLPSRPLSGTVPKTNPTLELFPQTTCVSSGSRPQDGSLCRRTGGTRVREDGQGTGGSSGTSDCVGVRTPGKERSAGVASESRRSDVPKLPVRGVLRLPRRGRLDHRPGRAVRVPGVAARPSHI